MPNATDFIDDLARSVGFLSRLPVPDRFFQGHDGSMARAVRAFPAAGLLLGLGPALVLYLLLRSDADPLLAALIALGLMTLLTGALHEDGLADAADGLGGGRDAEHALTIMKDSRTGSYGVVALILSFGLRAAALASLGRSEEACAGALALLAAAALSRAVMVGHWSALPSARAAGVAASAGMPDVSIRNVALAIGAALAIVVLLPAFGFSEILTALVVAGLAGFGFTRFVARKLGGHTGDTIGATQQIAEIATLAALALAA
ncbi:adenosylcobinamide-GDP ribazoletransferase [Rhizobium sp. LC145]|uniref:adenosylcobinamide-GDP ribazoletransferase n=1 Tax=Rhizobium sp. LC145 TaxID=1120688 RepID=UPI000629E4A2|nr:adenosylcobinamide-GDP ribazoletransferase [Rhizobium sp. LC145]KKX34500.1 cobalamin synthase [Rhizobium sp. LC145]TKT44282.1 adenosylcobinamide-GDP ribazoletransferase [Rhizobiaceae bacterium LC148]